ncbi:MAG: hypothetical protein ACE5HQ_09250 [Gemmatimonadota bacterium]
MRRPTSVVTALAVLAVLVAAALSEPLEAAAQALRSRMSRASDGWVRFAFEARPGVRGNCSHVFFGPETEISLPTNESSSECECASGPVRVELRVKDGAAVELQTGVGGFWSARAHPITDLGEVAPRPPPRPLSKSGALSPTRPEVFLGCDTCRV